MTIITKYGPVEVPEGNNGFRTVRYVLRYGHEDDPMDATIKYWEDLNKAIDYCDRYAYGIKFAGAVVEDENGDYLYELTDYGSRTFINGKEV